MNIDIGELTGFVAVISGAAMLVLSYMGAFVMGHARGRREAERERREEALGTGVGIGRVDQADRLLMVEAAVTSMAQAVERMSDAQRIALLERARIASPGESRLGMGRVEQRNTPA